MSTPFYFVLNPLEVAGPTPIELISAHYLQKANLAQIQLIQRHLRTQYSRHFPLPAYEYEWLQETKNEQGGTVRNSKSLMPDEFRYWVICFTGPNTHTEKLQLALNLLKSDLDLGFHFMYGKEGQHQGVISGHLNVSSYFESHNHMSENMGKGSYPIEAKDLQNINGYFESIKACEQDHPNIYKAVSDFFILKSLPRNSSLLVLGCFAVIESLVTHDPKDDFDSLNHQISTKMSLLSKRFERQLDYEKHFGALDREKVWKLLYGYRSTLAHGTTANFGAQFHILRNHGNAFDFLKEAAKLTLLFAMKEPEFLADLKKC
jgi:hypothetical protein